MKLPSPVVRVWQDIQRNFDAITKLLSALNALRFGNGVATWTATVNSANVVVTHNLGRVPVAVLTSSRDNLIGYAVTARTTTTFTVVGFTTHNVAVTTVRTFDWLAVG